MLNLILAQNFVVKIVIKINVSNLLHFQEEMINLFSFKRRQTKAKLLRLQLT